MAVDRSLCIFRLCVYRSVTFLLGPVFGRPHPAPCRSVGGPKQPGLPRPCVAEPSQPCPGLSLRSSTSAPHVPCLCTKRCSGRLCGGGWGVCAYPVRFVCTEYIVTCFEASLWCLWKSLCPTWGDRGPPFACLEMPGGPVGRPLAVWLPRGSSWRFFGFTLAALLECWPSEFIPESIPEFMLIGGGCDPWWEVPKPCL